MMMSTTNTCCSAKCRTMSSICDRLSESIRASEMTKHNCNTTAAPPSKSRERAGNREQGAESREKGVGRKRRGERVSDGYDE